jgi:hypothetical protein
VQIRILDTMEDEHDQKPGGRVRKSIRHTPDTGKKGSVEVIVTRKPSTKVQDISPMQLLGLSSQKEVFEKYLDFHEKYPRKFLRATDARNEHKEEDVSRNYELRLGPLWTFFPSTPTAFVNDATGQRLLKSDVENNKKSKCAWYIDAFPPGIWDPLQLLSRSYGVQADDEIASCMVNPNLRVYLHRDYRDFIRNRNVGMIDTLDEFSRFALKWVEAVLISDPTEVSWAFDEKHPKDPKDPSSGYELRRSMMSSLVKASRLPREPEYSVFVRCMYGKLHKNFLAPALYVNPERMFLTLGDAPLPAAMPRKLLSRISAHVLRLTSRGFGDISMADALSFDPSRSWTPEKMRKNLGSLTLPDSFVEQFGNLFNHYLPTVDSTPERVNMFNYREWIKTVTQRFGDLTDKYQELPLFGRRLLTLVAYAVFRGGIEVIFWKNAVFFSGNPMCALQQYRVWSRVLFLREDAGTIVSYKEHRRERAEVAHFRPDILVNAYDIVAANDESAHIGHGVDINTYSGITKRKSGVFLVAHEASVHYVVPEKSNVKISTNGLWGSRWHAWKSVGQYEVEDKRGIKLSIVLDKWRADETIDDDGMQSRPCSKTGAQEWNNEFNAKFMWDLAVGELKWNACVRRNGVIEEWSTSIESYNSMSDSNLQQNDTQVVLEWNYFVTRRTGSVDGVFMYEVFVSNVSVVAKEDYWSGVWSSAVDGLDSNDHYDDEDCGDIQSTDNDVDYCKVPVPNFGKCPVNNNVLAHYWNDAMLNSEFVYSQHLQRLEDHLTTVQERIDELRSMNPTTPPPKPTIPNRMQYYLPDSSTLSSIDRGGSSSSTESESSSSRRGGPSSNARSTYYFTLEELM